MSEKNDRKKKEINFKNRDKKNLVTGRVDFPETEDEYNTVKFKRDIAQQAGRFSDQVQLGSPAAEAGEAGEGAQNEIITAAEKKLAEKMNKKQQEKNVDKE